MNDIHLKAERYIHNGGKDSVLHDKIVKHLQQIFGVDSDRIPRVMGHLNAGAEKQNALNNAMNDSSGLRLAALGLLANTSDNHLDNFLKEI